MKFIHVLNFVLMSFAIRQTVVGQTYSGVVVDSDNQPLIGASVQALGSGQGTITNVLGAFSIQTEKGTRLVVSFIGFDSDTIIIENNDSIRVLLKQSSTTLGEVVVKSESTFIDELEPIHNEILLESELQKAACCNLSESFETTASVDVTFSDAVSGSKVIRMLGLDGRYVQISRESIPLVRGLSSRYGLGYIPGTWIQTIDVGKGAGSVVNGYESMTGQINLEFKKPENSEQLYLNGYVNSFGRAELNANHATDLKNNWSMAILAHVDQFNNEIDRNDDGFVDLPKSRQINFFNKFKYDGEHIKSQIGIQLMRDEKAGGQKGFGFGDDHESSSMYGFSNRTTQVEVFGKTGLLFPQKPYQGWGFIYSGSIRDIEAGFGRNGYEGSQQTVYLNAIYQNIIGNTFHQYKTGASLLYDRFEEVFADSSFNRNEVVPGAFWEYAYLPGDAFTLVAGMRLDQHNLYGTYFTPRIHARWQASNSTTVRVAAGRGYRTPNAIAENVRFLVSARELRIDEKLEPEVSWNMGGSIVSGLRLGERTLQIVGDYFYTTFEQQMVVDQDASSSQINIYNLEGDSYAHSLQLEASMALSDYWNVKGAYKYYDVTTTLNNELRQVPYVAKNRFFLNASYNTKYDKWQADGTLQWVGKKRLPDTSDKPVELRRGSFSPDYVLFNAQVSRGFRWGSIYLGAENLFDFRQSDPIIDAENPFGSEFDGSIVWGPVPGRVVYAGFRYKVKRK
ncbi:MAG: TonB-dependent receptor [Cyclobacteriaceae bacterium]|nr:TonB-dependent receptor [Cyclobacteriaceae bacterium HetDA_MAG_MS6]